MSTSSDDTNGFQDLGSIDHAHIVPGINRGNIIRRSHIGQASTPAPAASAEPSHAHAPEVLIHRDGDKIESIEFKCPCGQHAVVNLEYDDE